jgi:hypothetical protein
MNVIRNLDGALGRFIMRSCAVVAFLAAVAAAVFGAVVLFNGHIIGVVIVSAGGLFLWLGLVASRDRSTLGEILNRDFGKARKSKPETDTRETL